MAELMGSTMPNGERRQEVRSSDSQSTLSLIGAAKGPSTVDLPDGEWILPLIRDAIDATMPRKTAAACMVMDASLMKRQLEGDGHLSVKRLGALGEPFWRHLADALRHHFGMLDRAELIEQGEALIDRGRQMLAKAAQR